LKIFFKWDRFDCAKFNWKLKKIKDQAKISLMGSNHKKICRKLVDAENWLSATCGFLRTDILNFYRAIFGITGHPIKKWAIVFYWLFDAKIHLKLSCTIKKCQAGKGWSNLKKATLPGC
jgi:hypothetical protein